ncbi:MAG: trans-aconitate 2-methyltransferase [Vicinamibacterales bacterium]
MPEHLYTDLAEWWPLVSAPEEYAEEAAIFKAAILEFAPARPFSLLELGSGGGSNAVHLKADFEMTLVDRSPAMLRVSARLNPGVPHHEGDMRHVRLGVDFDAIFVHDAISYMTSREDLALAMETAFVHCRRGGVALFVPDETRERFVPGSSQGGHDDGPRGARYLEWAWDPDPDDETIVTDYAFLLREASGDVRVVHDRHVHGLFPRQVWLDTLAGVGFEPHSKLYEHSELEEGYEVFVGIRR